MLCATSKTVIFIVLCVHLKVEGRKTEVHYGFRSTVALKTRTGNTISSMFLISTVIKDAESLFCLAPIHLVWCNLVPCSACCTVAVAVLSESPCGAQQRCFTMILKPGAH